MDVQRVALERLCWSQPVGPGARHETPIPRTTYVICTNPRSGSELLCTGLASTSVAGNPREWFNPFEEQLYRARSRVENGTDLSFDAYLRLARLESMTSNGVSGIKLLYAQFRMLARRVEPPVGGFRDMSLMSAMFPGATYIWLRRKDKVRQAISLHLASQTNEWYSAVGSTGNELRGGGDVEFDERAIAFFESRMRQYDRGWQSFFDRNHIDPLVIEYETFVSSYADTIRKVIEWLGVRDSGAVAIPPAVLRRQSDARTEEWVTRYAALAPDYHDANSPNTEQISDFTPPRIPVQVIPGHWKQWVAEAQLLGYPPDDIVDVLTKSGHSRDAARAEAERSASDPYLRGSARRQQRLIKAVALLNIKGELQLLNPAATNVERCRVLSPERFRDLYYAANRPVIIGDAMTQWKALTAWTPDYLKSAAGDCVVEVMTGRAADARYDINADKHRTQMSFASYVDMVHSGKTTNDYDMTARNAFFEKPGTRLLLNDVTPLPPYLTRDVDEGQCFLWFGPRGTVTQLHHDPCNVLMAQVVGRKRFRLVPPEHWRYLYNNVGAFSAVDCEDPDVGRHPEFRHAAVIDIVLEPGEILFMPVGWWHHARALDVSMTVSFTNFVYPNSFSWD